MGLGEFETDEPGLPALGIFPDKGDGLPRQPVCLGRILPDRIVAAEIGSVLEVYGSGELLGFPPFIVRAPLRDIIIETIVQGTLLRVDMPFPDLSEFVAAPGCEGFAPGRRIELRRLQRNVPVPQSVVLLRP